MSDNWRISGDFGDLSESTNRDTWNVWWDQGDFRKGKKARFEVLWWFFWNDEVSRQSIITFWGRLQLKTGQTCEKFTILYAIWSISHVSGCSYWHFPAVFCWLVLIELPISKLPLQPPSFSWVFLSFLLYPFGLTTQIKTIVPKSIIHLPLPLSRTNPICQIRMSLQKVNLRLGFKWLKPFWICSSPFTSIPIIEILLCWLKYPYKRNRGISKVESTHY